MSLPVTVAVLIIAVAIAAFATYRERRPAEFGNPPLVPYTAVLLAALVIIILMAAHLITPLTGQPFAGRLAR